MNCYRLYFIPDSTRTPRLANKNCLHVIAPDVTSAIVKLYYMSGGHPEITCITKLGEGFDETLGL